MSYSPLGSSDKNIYGGCESQQRLETSTRPFEYQMYFGKNENCKKCTENGVWYKQNPTIVNIESELRNQTRPLSYCNSMKYNPNCTPSPTCISTFDPNAPKVLSPSLCPIVFNNIPKPTSTGMVPVDLNFCNQNQPEKMTNTTVNTFLSNCDKQPLYNGGKENVKNYMLF